MNNLFKNLAIWLVIGLVLMTIFNQFNARQSTQTPMEYSQFIEEVKGGRIAKVLIEGRVLKATTTEGKRVTVLEKFRRIYLVLRELEMPRWTDRERNGLMNELRDQIELVWMTGELHLEKPTVDREVAWGLHFFDETLFEMLPETLGSLEEALASAYPGARFEVPPFFQFGSWIGGDRDGNPFVTAKVTRRTLRRNALASLRRYRDGVTGLARTLSISERALPIPEAFRAALARQLDVLAPSHLVGLARGLAVQLGLPCLPNKAGSRLHDDGVAIAAAVRGVLLPLREREGSGADGPCLDRHIRRDRILADRRLAVVVGRMT